MRLGVAKCTVGQIFKQAEELNVLDGIQIQGQNVDGVQQSTDCAHQSNNGGTQRIKSFTNAELQSFKDSLNRLIVKYVKDLLRQSDLTLSGNKTDLIARLVQSMNDVSGSCQHGTGNVQEFFQPGFYSPKQRTFERQWPPAIRMNP